VIGGHLVEDDIIYTTAEVSIHSAHTYSIHIKFIHNPSKFIVAIPVRNPSWKGFFKLG